MKSEIKFAEAKTEKALQDLKDSKTEDKKLYKWICAALEDLQEDVFFGIQLPKRLIPKVYVDKYGIDNLWKYDLPKGWRLIYSVANGQICVLSIILEWMNHKKYERRFNY
jgi:Txe/YoeB family toxin of Txe-Axe toxin-antitoxin module